jgi:hypothetical protein
MNSTSSRIDKLSRILVGKLFSPGTRPNWFMDGILIGLGPTIAGLTTYWIALGPFPPAKLIMLEDGSLVGWLFALVRMLMVALLARAAFLVASDRWKPPVRPKSFVGSSFASVTLGLSRRSSLYLPDLVAARYSTPVAAPEAAPLDHRLDTLKSVFLGLSVFVGVLAVPICIVFWSTHVEDPARMKRTIQVVFLFATTVAALAFIVRRRAEFKTANDIVQFLGGAVALPNLFVDVLL